MYIIYFSIAKRSEPNNITIKQKKNISYKTESNNNNNNNIYLGYT